MWILRHIQIVAVLLAISFPISAFTVVPQNNVKFLDVSLNYGHFRVSYLKVHGPYGGFSACLYSVSDAGFSRLFSLTATGGTAVLTEKDLGLIRSIPFGGSGVGLILFLTLMDRRGRLWEYETAFPIDLELLREGDGLRIHVFPESGALRGLGAVRGKPASMYSSGMGIAFHNGSRTFFYYSDWSIDKGAQVEERLLPAVAIWTFGRQDLLQRVSISIDVNAEELLFPVISMPTGRVAPPRMVGFGPSIRHVSSNLSTSFEIGGKQNHTTFLAGFRGKLVSATFSRLEGISTVAGERPSRMLRTKDSLRILTFVPEVDGVGLKIGAEMGNLSEMDMRILPPSLRIEKPITSDGSFMLLHSRKVRGLDPLFSALLEIKQQDDGKSCFLSLPVFSIGELSSVNLEISSLVGNTASTFKVSRVSPSSPIYEAHHSENGTFLLIFLTNNNGPTGNEA